MHLGVHAPPFFLPDLPMIRHAHRARATQTLVLLSALALAVLKLLLVDLGRLAAVWRILLFMGFGGALLGLSSLFRPDRRHPPGPPPSERVNG